jgi:hypothetical protein
MFIGVLCLQGILLARNAEKGGNLLVSLLGFLASLFLACYRVAGTGSPGSPGSRGSPGGVSAVVALRGLLLS